MLCEQLDYLDRREVMWPCSRNWDTHSHKCWEGSMTRTQRSMSNVGDTMIDGATDTTKYILLMPKDRRRLGFLARVEYSTSL